ncbi:MAG: hypothetical protein ABIH23_19840 [bacterium]
MSTVNSLDRDYSTQIVAPRSPFPQADQGFERVLIAAADPNEKRQGLARPTPTRASTLRIPPANLNLTTGVPAANTSVQTTFKPLPLSVPAETIPAESVRPMSQPVAEPVPVASPQVPPENLAKQVVSDYQEYQQMMAKPSSAESMPFPVESPMPDLRPTSGQAPSPELAQPFARAAAESLDAPVPERSSAEEIKAVPRSPFPNLGQMPVATAPSAEIEAAPDRVAERSALAAYKDEQLLANAGGDDYVREADGMRVDRSYDHSRISRRVGKDLKDAGENLKDAARDLSTGSTTHERLPSGEVVAQRRPGLFGTLGNFAKDVVSGATLGIYRPKDEPAPKGLSRILYPFKKIIVDGVVKDLVVGVPASFLRAGEHTSLAALNAAESVPDATIGNLAVGRKMTSAAFDNVQVGASYLADVLPTGDAWSRVGASGRGDKWGIPVVTNLKAPEHDTSDPRFASVRNTPFRKGIETIGTLGAGAVLAAASAPAAVFGASAAMRTGTEMNAREVAQQIAAPETTVTQAPSELDPATSAALEALFAAQQTQRDAQAQLTAQAQAEVEQEATTRRDRPRLWATQ